MIAATEIVVRSAGEGDVNAVLELLEAALGPGSVPRTAEFWRWKHASNQAWITQPIESPTKTPNSSAAMNGFPTARARDTA